MAIIDPSFPIGKLEATVEAATRDATWEINLERG
jgi:hypothetical protein